MLSLLWTILVGLVVGIIAKLLHPGKENLGIIATIVLGVVGALAAGYLGQLIGWYKVGEGAGFIASILMAVLLLWIFQKIRRRS